MEVYGIVYKTERKQSESKKGKPWSKARRDAQKLRGGLELNL
jgi:hypothetical protein